MTVLVHLRSFAYPDPLARAIEYMIVDALKLAEPAMNIARRLENPKKYLHLTDHIQTEIEASEDPVGFVPDYNLHIDSDQLRT